MYLDRKGLRNWQLTIAPTVGSKCKGQSDNNEQQVSRHSWPTLLYFYFPYRTFLLIQSSPASDNTILPNTNLPFSKPKKPLLCQRINKNDNFDFLITLKEYMQGKKLRKLEAELWRAADQLRDNSKLTASEYPMPVLGLISLRHARRQGTK